ncbi:MAG: VWA domain-containing protein, partial [Proteobacteria bacterium]|nr:VWA domain-containing protein [Pseudomonadota bacterium]
MNAPMFWIPHLLRPWWLLALLALPLLGWWRAQSRRQSPWTWAVDAHLLPALLQEAPPATRSLAAWLFALGYVIAVFALSGPAWQQVAQPTFAPQSPLVVVEDMSSHMLVADLPPSRALRERLKVQQLIDARSGGQVGLVAYAGDAFTVAPISDDAHSLDDLVVALTPDTMPVDGQRADLALRRAADLLAQAGYTHGRILLLTDAVDAQAQQAAREVRAKGYTVDVLGVGTASGAPLPSADGRFVTDVQGSPQVARLDEPSLRE